MEAAVSPPSSWAAYSWPQPWHLESRGTSATTFRGSFLGIPPSNRR